MDGKIKESLNLFKQLNKRKNVKYVLYEAGITSTPDRARNLGANDFNLVKYEDFMKGNIPLPMENYTCPMKISQNNGEGNFSENCDYWGAFSQCEFYGKKECWEKFYGNAKSPAEKQKILKKGNF